MEQEEYYIDFDGVIVDSQNKINELFWLFGEDSTDPFWNEALMRIYWTRLLSISNELDGSFEVLRELVKSGANVSILSRVFSENEKLAKIEYLKSKGIYINFIACMGRVPKSTIIKPAPYRILVDDGIDNITDWRRYGGTGILIPDEEPNIKFLLKKIKRG